MYKIWGDTDSSLTTDNQALEIKRCVVLLKSAILYQYRLTYVHDGQQGEVGGGVYV